MLARALARARVRYVVIGVAGVNHYALTARTPAQAVPWITFPTTCTTLASSTLTESCSDLR
jgi:hypothetical protein